MPPWAHFPVDRAEPPFVYQPVQYPPHRVTAPVQPHMQGPNAEVMSSLFFFSDPPLIRRLSSFPHDGLGKGPEAVYLRVHYRLLRLLLLSICAA